MRNTGLNLVQLVHLKSFIISITWVTQTYSKVGNWDIILGALFAKQKLKYTRIENLKQVYKTLQNYV